MKKRQQQGFTLIELLASLAIGAAMLLGLSAMVDMSIKDMKGQQAAVYQEQVTEAAARYISENYGTLATAANTTVTTPVPMSTLINGGFLPPGFQPTNAYGQTPCLLFRAGTRTSGATTVYVVNALVVTEGTAAQRIPDGEISVIAANAGKGGGAITARTPTAAQGAFGSWQIDGTTNPTLAEFQTTRCSANAVGQGSLASALFFDGPDQLLTEFLYRSPVPGRPQLNQMSTPLGFVPLSAAIVAANSGCDASVPALAADTNNNLMFCDKATGKWTALTMWKAPVPTYNDLLSVPGAQVDEVRMVSNLNRAFTYTGSGWKALAVDQNGNLNVPGNLGVGTASDPATGKITATGKIWGDEVQATKEVAAGALSLSDGLWGNQGLKVNSRCDIGPITAPDGTTYYQWPIGTTIVDANGITMNCTGIRDSGNAHFVYQNGTDSP